MKALLLTIKNEGHYVPLDLGYVKSYCESINKKNSLLIDFCYPKSPFSQIISRIKQIKPQIIVFFLDNLISSKIFSLGYAVELFTEIRKSYPKIQLSIQSYKINQEFSKKILTENLHIDLIIRGEPEQTVNDILNGGEKVDIDGITFRYKDKILINRDRVLMQNLNILPSPYITNSIELNILMKNSLGYISTSRGCLFRCFYCFRSTKFPMLRTFSVERVLDEINYLITKNIKKIFIIDDCFIVNQKRFEDLAEAISKINTKEIEFSLMCRYEFLTEKNIDLLKKMNVKRIQIGLQTTNPKILKTLNRNFDRNKFELCVRQLQKHKISAMVDLILGLPGDDFAYFKNSFDYLLKIKPDMIRIHRLFIHPGTYLDINKTKYKIELTEKKTDYMLPVIKSNCSLSYYDLLRAINYIKIKKRSINIEFFF